MAAVSNMIGHKNKATAGFELLKEKLKEKDKKSGKTKSESGEDNKPSETRVMVVHSNVSVTSNHSDDVHF